MKRKVPALFFASVILTLILTACGGGNATPTPVPAQPPDGGGSGKSPVTPLVPIDLVGADVGTTMEWIDGSILVYVPPGEFTMGHGGEDNPEHPVVLDGFWIYRTKVTNRMYAQCVALGACPPPDEPGASKYENPEFGNEPIVGVNWKQADAYCKWVKGFLPTEAQWEKTARGPEGNLYPWGDAAPNCDLLNFDGCVGGTTNVTHYLTGRSFYEALDMEGNTFEWISDWYDPNYYRTSPVENPMGPEIGKVRSVRSSSFASGPDQTPSANRFFLPPEDTRADLGFRCVIAAPVAPPFCVETSYRPGRPGREPDLPGCELPEYSVAGAFCQGGNGYVNVDVGGPITDAGDYTVTADGKELDCSQTQTNRLTCSGITPDSKVEITVCGPGCDEGGDTPATTPPPNSGGEMPLCPTGYTYDTSTGQCEYTPLPGDPTGGDCAPGYQTTELGCEPTPNENGDCPTGYYFDANSEACLPGGGQSDCYFGFTEYPGQESCDSGCPEGYYYEAELQCCALEGGGPGPGCPVGYYYDIEMETCVPGENGYDYPDCPQGYYYDTGLETCLPTNDGGDTNCSEGYFYDTSLETCVPSPGGGDTNCPENYYYDTGLETCAPVPGGGQTPTCPDGYFFDTSLETCIPNGGDTNCPDGYFYDTGLETCTPGGGSDSNCASFSVYVEGCYESHGGDKECGPASDYYGDQAGCLACGYYYDNGICIGE
ncbi:MAG: formylglycine-generating enzyme family protein [Chloroflexi bacterium]|nr:formylglycine-generating enzyme family protein [Chloroflexota bacterium]